MMRFQDLSYQRAWERALKSVAQMVDETGMVYEITSDENYHSSVLSGNVVHRTMKNTEYMLVLLTEGTEEAIQKGLNILRKVLALQDQNPDSPTYGVWPYLWEEPFEKMKNPDWNWASFISRILITMLYECSNVLPEELLQKTRHAISCACECVIRRNMGVDYTNISLMGIFVLVCGGELLQEDRFICAGMEHMRMQLDFAEKNGSFAEYNSPTYGRVDLEETGRCLRYVQNPEARKMAEALNRFCWEVFAKHYHWATHMIAPPHARGYADIQSRQTISEIQLGLGSRCKILEDDELELDLITPYIFFHCPDDLVDFFRKPTEARVVKDTFYRGYDPIPMDQTRILLEKGIHPLTAYTYLHPQYCLGSFFRHDLWNQRKSLMGYFAQNEGVSCLRMRCLHDNMDFASSILTNVQHENTVAGIVHFVSDHGDYHYILTPLKDGTITADRFCLQLSLTGAIASAGLRKTGESSWCISMEHQDIHFHVLKAVFGAHEVRFETYQGENELGIRIILVDGNHITIDLNKLGEAYVVYRLEITDHDQAPTASMDWKHSGNTITVTLDGESVEDSAIVTPYMPPQDGWEKHYRNGGFYYTRKE